MSMVTLPKVVTVAVAALSFRSLPVAQCIESRT